MMPIINFKLTPNNRNFSIINKSDGRREFKFSNLLGSEKITVDNKHQIITSSSGMFRLDNFNKNYFNLMFEIGAYWQ